MDQNIATMLETVADTVDGVRPDHAAVVQGDRRRRWADFDRRSAQLAAYLADHGVGQGIRVAMGLYNSIEFLEALYAVFKLRAIPVAVNHRSSDDDLLHALDRVEAKAFLFDLSALDAVSRVAAKLPRLRTLVSTAPDGAQFPSDAGITAFETAIASAAPAPRIPRSGEDELILPTGGTTGRTKAVVWDHSALVTLVSAANHRLGLAIPPDSKEFAPALRDAVAYGGSPTLLPVSPMAHGTGFCFSLGSLLLGGTVVCPASAAPNAAEIWRTVSDRRVAAVALVGDAFARPMLAELQAAERAGHPYDLSSLQLILSSGAIWSAEVKHGLLEHGRMTLVDTIAAAEGGPFGVRVTRPGEAVETGRFALPPVARVLGPDDRDVVPGSGDVGILAGSGAVPLEYLDDPVPTEAVFRTIDGVRYAIPGDAARVEADGTVMLLGRRSDAITTAGETVFAEEVEQVVATCPGVADVVIVGAPDERWGHRVVAVVQVVPGVTLTGREISAHVVRHLAAHNRPRGVLFVDAVRRTPYGKSDRAWATALVTGPTGLRLQRC